MPTAQNRSPANSWNRIRIYRCAVVVVIAISAISLGCTAGRSKAGTSNISRVQSDQAKSPANANNENTSANLTAPTLTEVQAALTPIYQDTVTIDVGKSEPILLGDFNGDGSPDLAVVVRPGGEGALSKLNSEYANWIVEDPRTVVLPDTNKGVQQLPKPEAPPRIQSNDILLVVVHGYGQSGWHHPYARQTFLLCNSVGENMRARPLREVLRGDRKNIQPQTQGDVIGEKLSGHDGFLYWTNGKYAWHQ